MKIKEINKRRVIIYIIVIVLLLLSIGNSSFWIDEGIRIDDASRESIFETIEIGIQERQLRTDIIFKILE